MSSGVEEPPILDEDEERALDRANDRIGKGTPPPVSSIPFAQLEEYERRVQRGEFPKATLFWLECLRRRIQQGQ